MSLTFIYLLVLYQAKHFICDFPLQGRYMLGKFNKEGWVLPLAAHASVHAAATFLITVFFVGWWAIPLAIADAIIHFCMDRIKASPYLWGRYNHSQPQFWYALGVDQMVHHLTHYVIIICVMLLL